MAKNRDYTGLIRTPPSMAWLIRQRSILQGQLDQAKKELGRLPRRICELEQKLSALDDFVFPLHEVVIDPKAIKGRRKKSAAVLPYGTMTKNILECLRLTAQQPLYTTEIVLYLARHAGLDLDRQAKVALVQKVRWRLKNLLSKDIVARHHSTEIGSRCEGQWTLRIENEDEDSADLPLLKQA